MAKSLYHTLLFPIPCLVFAQSPPIGTSLAEDFIHTTTLVYDSALLSLDVKLMRQALLQDNFEKATKFYTQGRNSPLLDRHGRNTGKLRTLASLSTRAEEGIFDEDMPFLFHVYGLSGADPFQVDEVKSYADDFVMNTLKNTSSGTLASEAAVALNVHMFTLHKLSESMRDCSASSSGMSMAVREGQPATADFQEIGLRSFDEMIAFYVGNEQVPATPNGYSLYALAEDAARLFDTINPVWGGARVNEAMKSYYEEGRRLLSSPGACSMNSDTMEKLWKVANNIIASLRLPLMQMLLAALAEGDHDRIRMYALSIVPVIVSCRRSTHKLLQEKLLEKEYDTSDYEGVVEALQSVYSCLGFTCEETGKYVKTKKEPTCVDIPKDYALAGYKPKGNMSGLAKIDVDIHQIITMCEMSNWNVANAMYTYGKNSDLSLKEMATTKSRNVVDPIFEMFRVFHKNENYADKAIQDAFNGLGKWGGASMTHRTEVIAKTLKYQVVYMYALYGMHEALHACQAGDPTRNAQMAHGWDGAAALIIGSLEGPNEEGSEEDGMLFYNLANRLCSDFDRCKTDGVAVIENIYQSLFYAGRGAVTNWNCELLSTTMKKLEHMLIVPLIQAVLHTAIQCHGLRKNSPLPIVAEAETFALAVLPLVYHYDQESANIIERNLVMRENIRPMQDGPKAVVSAFSSLMTEFDIPCYFVGFHSGLEVCDKETTANYYGLSTDAEGEQNWIYLAAAGIVVVFVITFVTAEIVWECLFHI